MSGDLYEEDIESYEEDDYSGYQPSGENSGQADNVMRNFFNTANYIKKKIAYWQGFTIINDKPVRTHDPVAPDSFIFSIVGILDSIVNQHNSVSYIESGDKILAESMTAFNQSVLNEPLFNPDRYLMLAEEFDHMLEIFMGLVIKGHGKAVATALQAGVVAENQPKEEPKAGILSTASNSVRDLMEKKI